MAGHGSGAGRLLPAMHIAAAIALLLAAVPMADVMLEPGVRGKLGGVEPVPVLAGVGGYLLWLMRVRAHAWGIRRDRSGVPSLSELGLLVAEGVLFSVAGPLAVAMWATAASLDLLLRVVPFLRRTLDARLATRTVLHGIVDGLLFGALLAVGIDARGGAASVGDLLTAPAAIGAMLAAAGLAVGIAWAGRFGDLYDAHGERAWSYWLLWPCAGVIGIVAFARDHYDLWTLMALGVVATFVTASHALVMGQRSHPNERGGRGDRPSGKYRMVVELMPVASALLAYLTLAAGGIARLVE